MGSIPLALSIHNFISSVGADAGFAAIIGLAILVLLYFAHARETANLHDEASFLAQRLQEAEAQIALLTRQRVAPAPSVQPATVATAPAPIPFAPAGVAAPALAAATRVVPLVAARVTRPATAAANAVGVAGVATARVGARPAETAGQVAVAAAAGAAPPTATPGQAPAPASAPVTPAPAVAPGFATGTPAPASAPATTPTPRAPSTAPAPASPSPIARPVPMPAAQARAAAPAPPVAPGAASAPERVSAPASGQPRGPAIAAGPPATVAGGNGSGHVPSPPPPIQRPPARPAPARPASSQGGGRRPPTSFLGAERKPWRFRPVALIVGALGVAGVVVVLVLATSGGGPQAKSNGARTTNAPSARHAPAFHPAKVTVAVLNGTTTYHLAHNVSARLQAAGFKQGTVATASNQAVTATIVAYMPHHRSDALHVASSLKLGASAVQAVDQSALAVACPQPAPCTANVIVTVGSNLATT